MRIIDIAIKDLAQIFRDKRALLFLIALPIIFTLFMGFAYRGGEEEASQKEQPVLLGWISNDPDGLISTELHRSLDQSSSIQLVEAKQAEADRLVSQGEVAGVLVIPAGFDQSWKNAQSQILLITDTQSPQGQSLFQLLRSPVTQVMSSAEIASLTTEHLNKTKDSAEYEAAFAAAASAWAETQHAKFVEVELAIAQPEQSWYGDNPFNQASPGILVQFAIFGLVTSGQILMQERKTRTLQRMMTTALPSWQIIAGHLLAMFALVFIQEIILVVFGQIALGVGYAREPLAVLMITIALGLWVAAMGLLIGILAKNDSQVVLFSLIAMFIFSALGGAWFPLEASSGAFAAVGKIMPSAWAITGFQNILLRGLGLESAWLPFFVLLGYAFGFFALALWRFRKMSI
jgi:ABC-2 type transport system permease protein